MWSANRRPAPARRRRSGFPPFKRVDASLRAPQVLILCPTRELAVQVAEEIAKLAFFKRGVRELPIYGGQSYERQFRGLQRRRADHHRHAGPRHGSPRAQKSEARSDQDGDPR